MRTLLAMLLGVVLALWLGVAPANALIITQLGTGNAASGTSAAISTLASAPAGSLIAVAVYDGSSSGVLGSLSDGSGNTYAAPCSVNPDGLSAQGVVAIYYVASASALGSGGTITYTTSGGSGPIYLSAVDAVGLLASPYDTCASTSGSSASPSVSVTPTNWADLFIGWVGTPNTPVVTNDVNFTAIGSPSANHTVGGTRVGPGLSAVTYNPSYNSASFFGAVMIALKNGPSSSLALLGVGGGGGGGAPAPTGGQLDGTSPAQSGWTFAH